jgi:site-specific recombinase XerD
MVSSLVKMVSNFLKSRREGLSPLSIEFYTEYLRRADKVVGLQVSGQDIAQFLDNLGCKGGGKHAYCRVLRAFYNWLYSPKSGYKLNTQDNPILIVDAPKVARLILPSLTCEQLDYLIDQADCIRDKAIISLFADSGLRLSELSNIKPLNIDLQHHHDGMDYTQTKVLGHSLIKQYVSLCRLAVNTYEISDLRTILNLLFFVLILSSSLNINLRIFAEDKG